MLTSQEKCNSNVLSFNFTTVFCPVTAGMGDLLDDTEWMDRLTPSIQRLYSTGKRFFLFDAMILRQWEFVRFS